MNWFTELLPMSQVSEATILQRWFRSVCVRVRSAWVVEVESLSFQLICCAQRTNTEWWLLIWKSDFNVYMLSRNGSGIKSAGTTMDGKTVARACASAYDVASSVWI